MKGACGAWIAAAAVWALVVPREAHAYLDPGTGSMLLSAVVSVFVTAGFALQSYGYRILGLFRREKPDERKPEPGEKRAPEQPLSERSSGRA